MEFANEHEGWSTAHGDAQIPGQQLPQIKHVGVHEQSNALVRGSSRVHVSVYGSEVEALYRGFGRQVPGDTSVPLATFCNARRIRLEQADPP